MLHGHGRPREGEICYRGVAPTERRRGHVNAPSRKIGKRKLTREEYDQYQVAIGTLRPRLEMMVSAPAWKQVPAEDRKDMIEILASDTRREARRSLFGAGGSPKGASAPPPPPGFTIVQ